VHNLARDGIFYPLRVEGIREVVAIVAGIVARWIELI
jgi:hypothetical protein